MQVIEYVTRQECQEITGGVGSSRPKPDRVSVAGDRSIAQVAHDFDLVESAVRRWVEQAEVDDGRRRG